MCMASMRESRGSDRFKSTHKYNHMYCCAEGLALQCLSLCTLMKSYRAANIENIYFFLQIIGSYTVKLVLLMNSNYLSQDNGCTLQTSKSKEENYLEGAVIDSEQWLVKRLHKQNITFVDLESKENGNNIKFCWLI